MKIRMTTRRCDVDDGTLERAEDRLSRLVRFESRLTSAEVVFVEERHAKRVEAVLTVDGSEPVVASAEASEFGEAVDRLQDRLDRILRKRRAQRRNHQAPGIKNLPQPDEPV